MQLPIPSQVLKKFEKLLKRARETDLSEPTAMTLSTVNKEGRPSSRTVLLKGFDEQGFVFFTNQESRKGEHLASHPWASLCFYWDALHEQSSVEGRVVPVSDEESDAYWVTRPRASQIGAWASLQSRPLESRAHLMARVAKYTIKFPGRIPRPPYWSGLRVIPTRIEFWTSRPYRLHVRTVYTRTEEGWTEETLYP